MTDIDILPDSVAKDLEIVDQDGDTAVDFNAVVAGMREAYTDVEPSMFALTEKQWKFAMAYPETFDSLKAARAAGYNGDEITLRVCAWQNLRRDKVKFWIEKFITERALPADAVLARLADIATGSLEDFISIYGDQPFFDITKAEKHGKMHLIKKLKYLKDGPNRGGYEIELHDPLRALELLGKSLGMFDDAAVKVDNYTIKIVREGNDNS